MEIGSRGMTAVEFMLKYVWAPWFTPQCLIKQERRDIECKYNVEQTEAI